MKKNIKIVITSKLLTPKYNGFNFTIIVRIYIKIYFEKTLLYNFTERQEKIERNSSTD